MSKPIIPPPQQPRVEPGVADYFNGRSVKTRSILIALAADILILARCEGAPQTARYFSAKLGLPVTEKMIKVIKAKAAKGEIIVTRDDLAEAAMAHPISAARMHREPSLCDPQHYRSAFPPKARKKPTGKNHLESFAPGSPQEKARKKPDNPDETLPWEPIAPEQVQPSPWSPRLVAEFCESEFYPKSRGFLVPYAAQVVYIARMCRSTRLTAAFLSKKFGRKFSSRSVEDILAHVKSGEILVTAEQLTAAADEHPYARLYADTCPDILQ